MKSQTERDEQKAILEYRKLTKIEGVILFFIFGPISIAILIVELIARFIQWIRRHLTFMKLLSILAILIGIAIGAIIAGGILSIYIQSKP